MGFFIFPQSWIAPAITAAALHFGSIGETTHIQYRKLPANQAGGIIKPNIIVAAKRPKSEWPKPKVQCFLIHEYGHLRGRKHSDNPRSIMFPNYRERECRRWLRRHGVK
jgi:Matrixin